MSEARETGSSDRWFVTNGGFAAGSVTCGLVLRGVAHGRFVRLESWQI